MLAIVRPGLEQLAAQVAFGPVVAALTNAEGQVLCAASQQAQEPRVGSAFAPAAGWSQASAAVLVEGEPIGTLRAACAGEGADLARWVEFTAGLLSRQLDARGEGRQRFFEVISQVSRFTAHALGNPLAGLSLTVELLGSNPQSNSAPRFIDRSQRIIERLTEFKENLGALGLEAVELAEVPAETWLKQVIDAQNLDPAYKLQLQVAPSVAVLRCHPGLLANALGYLLRNITDAMPDGGDVGVEVEDTGSGVRLVVWDSGPGMPDHLVPDLFHVPVSTRKHGGGMGLMLVAMTVSQLHGGTVRYESRSPHGSRFIMDLPHHAGATTC